MDTPQLHHETDGTVTLTYFGVYDQRWHRRAEVDQVPAREIAAMPEPMRSQIIAAQDLARQGEGE